MTSETPTHIFRSSITKDYVNREVWKIILKGQKFIIAFGVTYILVLLVSSILVIIFEDYLGLLSLQCLGVLILPAFFSSIYWPVFIWNSFSSPMRMANTYRIEAYEHHMDICRKMGFRERRVRIEYKDIFDVVRFEPIINWTDFIKQRLTPFITVIHVIKSIPKALEMRKFNPLYPIQGHGPRIYQFALNRPIYLEGAYVPIINFLLDVDDIHRLKNLIWKSGGLLVYGPHKVKKK